jgi:hypothetical protein
MTMKGTGRSFVLLRQCSSEILCIIHAVSGGCAQCCMATTRQERQQAGTAGRRIRGRHRLTSGLLISFSRVRTYMSTAGAHISPFGYLFDEAPEAREVLDFENGDSVDYVVSLISKRDVISGIRISRRSTLFTMPCSPACPDARGGTTSSVVDPYSPLSWLMSLRLTTLSQDSGEPLSV